VWCFVVRNKGLKKYHEEWANRPKEHSKAPRLAVNSARLKRAGHEEQQLELNGLSLLRNRTLMSRSSCFQGSDTEAGMKSSRRRVSLRHEE
jgi:hypothetical protein